MVETCSDGELLKRIANRDRTAIEVLYDRYERLLYSFARKAVPDDFVAEEIVQDVFIKVWGAAHTYDERQAKLTTWLLTIARRTAIDHARKRQKLIHSSTNDEVLQILPDDTKQPYEWTEVLALRQTIQDALNELPGDQKLLIERIYLQGLSQREMAELLQLPIGTVKSRIRLGLAKLKDKLTATGWEVTP